MPHDISLSIIICTRNRAESLRQTLYALGKVRIHPEWKSEVIIVDNASTDNTAAVVRSTAFASMQIVYLHEPRKGRANALNSGLAKASGEIILLTDDDVVPSEDWVEQVLNCFFQTQCDALVGKVELAAHLERPWMGRLSKGYLAVTDFKAGEPLELVGANCAFRRFVLERVPGFDPELGSGALGYGEETIFGLQLLEAGFKVEYAKNALVVHWQDKSRLCRGEWLKSALQRGRSKAYCMYHWEHEDIRNLLLKRLWLWSKLRLRRTLQPLPALNSEGYSAWELSYVYHLSMCKHYCVERRRPRNYSRRGLIKCQR